MPDLINAHSRDGARLLHADEFKNFHLKGIEADMWSVLNAFLPTSFLLARF